MTRGRGVGEQRERGPVDYVVVELPVGTRDVGAAMARELASLVDAELIRLVDLVVVEQGADGSTDTFEMSELGDIGALRGLETERELLADGDVARLAEAVPVGRAAMVVVWENRWAVPLGDAAREAGGQVVATGALPAPMSGSAAGSVRDTTFRPD